MSLPLLHDAQSLSSPAQLERGPKSTLPAGGESSWLSRRASLSSFVRGMRRCVGQIRGHVIKTKKFVGYRKGSLIWRSSEMLTYHVLSKKALNVHRPTKESQ